MAVHLPSDAQDLVKFLSDTVLPRTAVFSILEQPHTSMSKHPRAASELLEDCFSSLSSLLSQFRGDVVNGRYWTVLYDTQLPFVLKVSKRPRSRRSMGRRATHDYALISAYLKEHVPWQCVLEAHLPEADPIYLMAQDLIVPEYSLGATDAAELYSGSPTIDRIASCARLKDNVIDLVNCVVLMNKETLAVPDLWGNSNIVIHEASATLVDTSVLYSPAEAAPMGREGYFKICHFLNELLSLLGHPQCLTFSEAPRSAFSLDY